MAQTTYSGLQTSDGIREADRNPKDTLSGRPAVLTVDTTLRVHFACDIAKQILSIPDFTPGDLPLISLLATHVPEIQLNELESLADSGDLRSYSTQLENTGDEANRYTGFIQRVEIGEAVFYVMTIQSSPAEPHQTGNVVEMDRLLTRGEIAGEIAHEMNNYLTILLGNVEIIPIFCNKKDCQTTFKKLDLLKETLEKVASFSDSLADYGTSREPRLINNLNGFIDRTIAFFAPQNRFDGIEFTKELREGLPSVVCDLGGLQQVLGDLLQNAADELTESGIECPRITVSTESTANDEAIVISVADNGRGVPEAIHDKLFKVQCSGKAGGEGLGLLACNQIVKRHGGSISFRSGENEGSTFSIRLPRASVPGKESYQE